MKVHEDNGLVRAALEEPGDGRVLVVDGGGSLRCALVGDNLAALGAGNGWLSRRMAERGHYVLATDISLDDEDGLGALDRYGSNGQPWRARVTRARADIEALALEGSQFDLVVANGYITQEDTGDL